LSQVTRVDGDQGLEGSGCCSTPTVDPRDRAPVLRVEPQVDRWLRSASNREDQCVIPSSAGGSVNVIAKISSRTSRAIVGGLPDRGASARPASPRVAKRERHITTAGSAQPTLAAICFPGTPSADSSTIRARSTSRAGEPFARSLRVSSTRSESETVNTLTRFGMQPVSHRTHQKLMRQTTGRRSRSGPSHLPGAAEKTE